MSKTYTGRILLTHSTFKINLVVGDFFKSQKGEMAKWAKKASNLITWLRSKTIILSHLRQLRIEVGLTALAVIRAVLTRWMAHYMAYRRLLELQPQLNLLIVQDATKHPANKIVVTGDAKAKAKAKRMAKLISEEPLFWYNIAWYIL